MTDKKEDFFKCLNEECQAIFKGFVIDSKKEENVSYCVVCGSQEVSKIDD